MSRRRRKRKDNHRTFLFRHSLPKSRVADDSSSECSYSRVLFRKKEEKMCSIRFVGAEGIKTSLEIVLIRLPRLLRYSVAQKRGGEMKVKVEIFFFLGLLWDSLRKGRKKKLFFNCSHFATAKKKFVESLTVVFPRGRKTPNSKLTPTQVENPDSFQTFLRISWYSIRVHLGRYRGCIHNRFNRDLS